MRVVWSAARYAAVVVLAMWLSACVSVPVGQYSLDAYKNATSLKAETLALMGKATESFSKHGPEVEALTVKIDAAYEFAAGLPNNQLSAAQWALLRAQDGNLYGGFVRTWRAEGRVSPSYEADKRDDVAAAFDEIICLEANKQTKTKCESN